ncbi:hypothetical protein [Lentilactobacillus sp. Marseille-Q4993]|uniref:hypothetical protein n=1 Tax=Lentilactobacillus sp. Marseille-Q4993 TaxID=3039492 RepID=UPI0024BC6474|nr:hypothetical protein [Lentilactobacillus sp. Marseille-Q4993]
MKNNKRTISIVLATVLVILIAWGGIHMYTHNRSAEYNLNQTAKKYKQSVGKGDFTEVKVDKNGNEVLMGVAKNIVIVQYMKKGILGYNNISTKVQPIGQMQANTVYDFVPIKKTGYFAYGILTTDSNVPRFNGKRAKTLNTQYGSFWYGVSSSKENATIQILA